MLRPPHQVFDKMVIQNILNNIRERYADMDSMGHQPPLELCSSCQSGCKQNTNTDVTVC